MSSQLDMVPRDASPPPRSLLHVPPSFRFGHLGANFNLNEISPSLCEGLHLPFRSVVIHCPGNTFTSQNIAMASRALMRQTMCDVVRRSPANTFHAHLCCLWLVGLGASETCAQVHRSPRGQMGAT